MLAHTQIQLEDHFRTLSRDRAALGYPVYAFEHGLDSEQLHSVRRALCDDLNRTKRISSQHWLLWTVVAAEVGYTYDGDEYWYSFGKEIPRWGDLGSREVIRGWFQDFMHRFNGFQPTGRWAEHFSIIAWPITHSILPRYLQAQFARHIYEMRYDLAVNNRASVDELGQLLGESYQGISSRFANFLQQTALTARLVLALRDEDVEDAVAPIFKPTLTRIVYDLERKGSSKGYLRDTRRILRDARTRVQNGLSGRHQIAQAAAAGAAPKIPSGVKLVAHRAPDGAWTMGVSLPNFVDLFASCGVHLPALAKVRFGFVDRPDTWSPATGLLSYSNKDHALSMLPREPDKPIICFRGSPEEMAVCEARLKLQSHPPWLLRVHSDGIARQILGNHIRTGEEYIIAGITSVNTEAARALTLQPVACRTAGLSLFALNVPDVVSADFVNALQKLSLGYALRARVRPFGLVPRWDEVSGCSIWLLHEEILLHLAADFPVAEFSLSISGEERTRVPMDQGQDAIVSLGHLPPGRFTVEITAVATGTVASHHVAPETIVLEVRAPRPWRSDPTPRTGIRIVLEPREASFDDLVERRAFLEVHGPRARTATVEARLYDVSGYPKQSSEIGHVDLPSKSNDVTRALEKLTAEPLSEAIQSASRIDLAFVVDELGSAKISFPHAVTPFRWKLTNSGNSRVMRLIDEKDAGKCVEVSGYDLGLPDKRIELSFGEALRGIAVSPPGRLFVVSHDGSDHAALASVAPQGKLVDFTQLVPRIHFGLPRKAPAEIMHLLAIYRLWRFARSLGALAALRKKAVLAAFENCIEQLMCGPRWAEKTQSYRSEGVQLEQLQAEVGGSPGFAYRMRTNDWQWSSDPDRACSEFFRLAGTYGLCHDQEITDLALCLAFCPTGVDLVETESLAAAFDELLKLPILARGAYFARLASNQRFPQARSDSEAVR